MCDFKDARVGDRVWSIEYGWGKVYSNQGVSMQNPIVVQYADGGRQYFTYEGKHSLDNINPSLFWDEVKITPPLKPKRKVKRVIEGYIQITDFRTHDDNAFWISNLFETKEGAMRHARAAGKLLGEPLFISHEYEDYE